MKLLKKIYLVIIFLFLYAPIGVLFFLSFNNSRSRSHWGGFTLNWYKELLSDPDILKAFFNSLSVAFISASLAVIIGTCAALCIFNLKKAFKNIIIQII